MKKKILLGLLTTTTLGVLAGVLIQSAWADGIPGGEQATMYYSGFLEDEAGPVEGSPVIRVSLWTAAEPGTGTELCATPSSAVTVTEGYFRVGLPASCVRAVQEHANVWTEVQIGSDLPLPRQHLGAVPYAVEAGNGVPPGAIVPFGGESAPDGWALCDGQAVSGAAGSPYHRLYEAIGEAWGDGGDGTGTMFNLPDLRGRFLRGTDRGAGRDPDRDARDPAAAGGNDGDAVGSVQGHAFARHDHGGGRHDHSFSLSPCTHTNYAYTGLPLSGNGTRDGTCGDDTGLTRYSGNIVSPQGDSDETRPVNAAVDYVIKL